MFRIRNPPCIPPTLEVIVVNDGSKDRSLDIMKAFQQKKAGYNPHHRQKKTVTTVRALMQGYKWQKEIFQTLGRRRLDGYGGFIKLLNVLKNCDTDLFITLRTEYKIDKNNRHIVTFPLPQCRIQ